VKIACQYLGFPLQERRFTFQPVIRKGLLFCLCLHRMAIITFKVSIFTFINQSPVGFQYLNTIFLAAVFTGLDFFRLTFTISCNILKHNHF